MNGEIVITAGALSSLLLEGVKYLVKWIKKDPTFCFPVAFYAVMLPVLNAVMPFVMTYVLGMPATDPVLSMTWQGVLRYVVLVAVGAVISVATNAGAINPFTNYASAMKVRNAQAKLDKQASEIFLGK